MQLRGEIMQPANIQPKTKIKFGRKNAPQLRVAILVIFVLSVFWPSLSAMARTFNPHNIITDHDLMDKDSLSRTAIQVFLERENSVLARYSQIIDGRTLKASEMIWEIGQKHGISPKYLLATLEKEQSLISRTTATEKALDWATGYSCYGGGCNEKYRGFYNQVEAAAETQQIYIQKAGQFSFRVGVTSTTFDGFAVTPANNATANFYIYTPYVGNAPELGINSPYGGNKLFWRIWNRYFTDQKFLDGQIMTDGSNYWLIDKDKKCRFISREIFLANYKQADAIYAAARIVNSYPDGPTIYYPDKSLVRSSASNQIFYIADGKKHPLADDTALAALSDVRLAVVSGNIRLVSEDTLSAYGLGPSITSASAYPQGKIFKDETGIIWHVQYGMKHQVDPLVYQNRFGDTLIEPSTSIELSKYFTGAPLLFKDGTFVSYNGSYYLITNGERMKIMDPGVFTRVFGQQNMAGAVPVSLDLLNLHAAGEMIDYIDDTIADPVNYASNSNAGTPAASVAGSLAADFVSLDPQSLIIKAGGAMNLTVKMKNSGSAVWQPGNVWLKVTDQNNNNVYGVDKVNFAESSVASSQEATFALNLTAPANSGMGVIKFALVANDGQEFFSQLKFIIIKPGDGNEPAPKPTPEIQSKAGAEVISETMPDSISASSRPVEVIVKLKNTGKTTWLSKRTAFEIYNDDGTSSYFYDPNDWIRKEVAAVPINQAQIKPGETGVFKYTLDPRGIKAGTYSLVIQVRQLDIGQQVLFNGQKSWVEKITVK